MFYGTFTFTIVFAVPMSLSLAAMAIRCFPEPSVNFLAS